MCLVSASCILLLSVICTSMFAAFALVTGVPQPRLVCEHRCCTLIFVSVKHFETKNVKHFLA